MLVEGVTKFDQDVRKNLHISIKDQSLKKFFSSLINDPRIIMVKFADRLHNMQTIYHLKPSTQIRIAKETEEFYVPLASAVNEWTFKRKFSDLCFKTLMPNEYYDFECCLSNYIKENSCLTHNIKKVLLEESEIMEVSKGMMYIQNFLPYELKKYSHKSCLANQHLFRLIILSEDSISSYLLLGLLHNIFPPVKGKINDYVAKPKINTYQALHTQIIFQGKQLECIIQLEKHGIEEKNRLFKNKIKKKQENFYSIVQNDMLQLKLINLIEKIENSTVFLHNLKHDVLAKNIVVYDKNGNSYDLPKGSSMVDMFFASEKPWKTNKVPKYGLLNSEKVPMRIALNEDDVVEFKKEAEVLIISPILLQYTKTTHARHIIHTYLSNLNTQEIKKLVDEYIFYNMKRFGCKLKSLTFIKSFLIRKKLNHIEFFSQGDSCIAGLLREICFQYPLDSSCIELTVVNDKNRMGFVQDILQKLQEKHFDIQKISGTSPKNNTNKGVLKITLNINDLVDKSTFSLLIFLLNELEQIRGVDKVKFSILKSLPYEG